MNPSKNFRVTTLLAWVAGCQPSTAQAAPAPEPSLPENLNLQTETADPTQLLALACRYRDGKGVEKNSREAMRLGHLAADQGHPGALDFIGWMYFSGDGVPRQPRLAAAYFASAAEQNPQAAWNLGQCQFAGLGVELDVPKALETWRKAAAAGHGRAASTAAMVLLAGDGVPPNPAEARLLAERAAALKDPNGLVLLGEILWQAGEADAARATWTQVAAMFETGATGHPEQPSDRMAAQQGADLIRLMDHRKRQPKPGAFAFVPVPHIHQGWNNCGASSCAMYARSRGLAEDSWAFKKRCPSPTGSGTDWADLLNAGTQAGLRWKLVTFPPDDDGFNRAVALARGELDAGRPLVIDFKYIGPQYKGGAAGHTLLLCGYLGEEDLYILCNPAIASPGLQLMTGADLKRYWRSDGYSHTSKGELLRPAFVAADP